MDGVIKPVGRGAAVALVTVLLGLAALAAASAGPDSAGATVAPTRCGKIQVNGKTYRVKAHLTACDFARKWSKKVLRGNGGPDGWTCDRYPASQTRIAFVCRKAGKDFFAIRK